VTGNDKHELHRDDEQEIYVSSLWLALHRSSLEPIAEFFASQSVVVSILFANLA
jgi:hypothetical protein